jgi:hypothetical protein
MQWVLQQAFAPLSPVGLLGLLFQTSRPKSQRQNLFVAQRQRQQAQRQA